MAEFTPGPQKAGIVVVQEDGPSWRCLLLRAYRNWGWPKGEIEPGETPLAAAQRETAEETSLTRLEFRWGEVYIDTAAARRHKIARYYLTVSHSASVYLPVSAELGRPEHHEFRWVSFADAKVLLTPYLQPVVDWAENICRTVPR